MGCDCLPAEDEEAAGGGEMPFGDADAIDVALVTLLLVWSLMRSAYDPRALKTDVWGWAAGGDPDILNGRRRVGPREGKELRDDGTV